MAFALTDSLDQRTRIFRRLGRRNRLVGLLRIALPAIGVLAFLLLAGQIWLAGLARQYGVSGLSIDRGNLVVEAPRYSGMGTDGSRYLVAATQARAPLDAAERIEMTAPTLEYTRPHRATFHILAATAIMDTAAQRLTIPGTTRVDTDDGLHGTLVEVKSDIAAEVTTADGAVDITFPDGTTLRAGSLRYDGKARTWTFEHATLTISELPEPAGDDGRPTPPAAERQ